MLTSIRKRIEKQNEGFTLIELMVVVLIIAILIAIAIPTFLGAQDRARDRAAQSDLRNAATAAKTIATDDAGLFTNVNATTLAAAEGSQTYGAADGTDGTTSSIGWDVDLTASPQVLVLSKVSASGKAFAMKLLSNGQITYCSHASDVSAVADTADACAGAKW
jgi:type IV pilus assembly protein PilA